MLLSSLFFMNGLNKTIWYFLVWVYIVFLKDPLFGIFGIICIFDSFKYFHRTKSCLFCQFRSILNPEGYLQYVENCNQS